MKVLLRNVQSGFYYRGASEWTPERTEARDLLRSEAAVRLASNFRLQSAEVVLTFGPSCDDVVLRL